MEPTIDGELFSLIMANSPDLMFVKDERSVILYGNRAFLDVYPPERRHRIIGTTTAEQFSAEEAATFLEEDRRALECGASDLVEEIVDYTGRKRVFLVRKIAFATSHGERRLLGIASDITELAARESDLVELNGRLQSFTAVAAHDLRSPLATFVSVLHLVKRDRGSTLSPMADGYLDLMIESATGLAANVTSVLVAARATHAQDMPLQDCDLNILFNEVKFNLADAIQKSGAQIYSNRLPRLAVEENLFRQMLQNLIENSIKNRGDHRPRVVVRHRRTGCRDILTVEDNGRGISTAAVARVFNIYEQDGKSGIKGVGIGLALCKRVAELHGGTIQIDAAHRNGCKVIVNLPARPTEPISLERAA